MDLLTKKAIIFGFHDKSSIQAMHILEQKKIIDIKVWIGNAPECTHDIMEFYSAEFQNDPYCGSAQHIYNDIFSDSIYKFMDMMSRHSFYKEKNFYDLVNIYNLFFNLFADSLLKNCIDVVIFSDLPHEGADLILYQIAKKLNIKTILCHQTIFPNRFFYVYDVNDYGLFKEAEISNEEIHHKVNNVHEEYIHFHSSKIKNKGIYFLGRSCSMWGTATLLIQSPFKKNNYNKLRLFIHKRKQKSSTNSENKSTFMKYLRSLNDVFQLFADILTRFNSFTWRQLQRYGNWKTTKKNLASIITYNINFEVAFIYFPLHLQPELTTSGLGDLYVDQLLAIERLSTIIPDGWLIYVKENPSQTELMRGKWFFKRLHLIKNVLVVPPNYSTDLLIEKCIFVATVTGTAGWEAISIGKNALVFGNAWYKTLPGVFSYDSDFKLDDILSYKINANELDRKFHSLLSKTANGVTDTNYAHLVDNYNDSDNASNIAIFFEHLLDMNTSVT